LGFGELLDMNYSEEDFRELVESYKALLVDYEHVGFMIPSIRYRAIESLAKADKLMPTVAAGANIEDYWKHQGRAD
jgi:hypothetical protein